METVDELFERDRRSDRTTLIDETGRAYDHHWLCTTTWKAGNFLRHTGVRRGVRVGIVGEGPLGLLACFGTVLLEGAVQFDPPRELSRAEDLRTLVAPVDDLSRYELPLGAQRVGYGSRPGAPDVHHFDAGLWSENPSFPPVSIDPETPLLDDGDRALDHGTVVRAARQVVDEFEIGTGTRVAVEAPLSDPRTVTAGVVAPLLAEGVVVLGGGTDAEVDVSVVDADAGRDAIDGRSLPLDAVALDDQ